MAVARHQKAPDGIRLSHLRCRQPLMNTYDIAVLISTYQRPAHLERVLASVAAQRSVAGRFEVVVSDDGSIDETPQIVRQFASSVDFPVRFTTHAHEGFRLAKCRNDGVRASNADYLVFLDGDCLMPPDFLATHQQHKKRGIARAGFCCWLDRETSERITIDNILSGDFINLIPAESQKWIRQMHWKSRFYNCIRHASKPKLFGGNVGIYREDYERVNGYDENFRGWGCEDDDLRLRLRQAAVGIRSIAHRTQTYHLWHPPTPTKPEIWKQGENIAYFMRANRSVQCESGLVARTAPSSTRSILQSPTYDQNAHSMT